MQTIPKEIDDAAIIDGCNPWQLFTKIIIPLSRNGLVVVLIIAFIGAWNDYIWAMILLPTQLERTFTVALAFFKTEFFTDYVLLSACVIVGLLPVIVGYVFLQDKLIIGLTEPDKNRPELVKTVVETGGRILEVSEREHQLEEIYLKLIREGK